MVLGEFPIVRSRIGAGGSCMVSRWDAVWCTIRWFRICPGVIGSGSRSAATASSTLPPLGDDEVWRQGRQQVAERLAGPEWRGGISAQAGGTQYGVSDRD